MICTKWSKDVHSMGNISKNLLNSRREIGNFRENLKNSLIFHSHSCRVHSCRYFLFFVDLPKHHQNWIDLVIRGPNLIGCDKMSVKPLNIKWNAMKITKNWVGICLLVVKPTGHLVHDTKWGGGVGPLKFSKFPLCDHGVHSTVLQTPLPPSVRGSSKGH